MWLVAIFGSLGASVEAGEIADKATLADTLLERGYPEAGLAAFDKATAAFWSASPLQFRAIVLADDVDGYGSYTERSSTTFRKGDTLSVYFEPVGHTFTPTADGVRAAIDVDVEIRTPGGLILGSADDFASVAWMGRKPIYEVHATIATELPDLKPGPYLLLLTFRDQGSAKVKEVTLPFSIIE